MEDTLLEAREELKRLEHIIYVSLKYTRTVDVILGALRRMVATCDFMIEGYLEKVIMDKKIDSVPKSPALRAKHVEEIYSDDKELLIYLKFYRFLKHVLKQQYTKRREYRRHVTLVAPQANSTIEINIDNLVNCERFMHSFFTHTWHTLIGKPEEDDFA